MNFFDNGVQNQWVINPDVSLEVREQLDANGCPLAQDILAQRLLLR